MLTHYVKHVVPAILCLKVTQSLAEVTHNAPSPPPSSDVMEGVTTLLTPSFIHLVTPGPPLISLTQGQVPAPQGPLTNLGLFRVSFLMFLSF